MRRVLPLLYLALLAASAGAPAAANPMGPDQFLVLDKEALLVMPPRQVTTGLVSQAEWSPGGKYVLAFASELPYPFRLPLDRPPSMKGKLALWSAASGESKQIFTVDRTMENPPRFTWFSRGDAALVSVELDRPVPPAERKGGPATRPEEWLYILDAGRGVMKPVQRVPKSTQLSAAPAYPAVLLWSWEESALKLAHLNGSISTLALPPSASLAPVQWLADGKRAWIGVAPGPDEKRPRFVIADVEKGTMAVADQRPELYRRPMAGDGLQVAEVETRLGPSDGPLVRSLWLTTPKKTEKSAVLIAADAEWGKLSPGGEALLYADSKGAWVVRPVRIPKEMFFQARLAALRATLQSNGKQLGTALHMYAADHNDEFPGQATSIISALQPYLKNDRLFDGFTYTFPGGRLDDIPNPAEVVIGHVAGADGRALIYADGHVRWESAGPPPAPK